MAQIYLISPPKIELKQFSVQLEKALKTSLVPVFQLRLKDYQNLEVKKISKELLKICYANNCQLLINDFFEIALEIGANGVHLGAEDGSIKIAREKSKKINPNFVIGASCYDSKHLAMEAGEQGADYISFGTFFPSKTKNSQGKPTTEILEWANELLNIPTVAIGGITDQNCAALVKAGADFLAVISYVWENPAGVEVALKKLSTKIK
ncbi:MAG: thiamine phosphate synthase [Proteobacteria bacterium]|nr:thiamine phosphate synthase [Pseudomonadota bacterium]